MSKHDDTVRRVYGVTIRTLITRILRVFDAATPRELEKGAQWYDDAGRLAESLAPFTTGQTTEHAASVIAALSPRTEWTRNVEGATTLLRTGALIPGLLGENVKRARVVDVEGFAGFGPAAQKTRAFARNIAGDREAVTVDVWAARVAGVDEEKLSRKGAYDAVAHAYRLAARRRGVAPTTMQATTWEAFRNGPDVPLF